MTNFRIQIIIITCLYKIVTCQNNNNNNNDEQVLANSLFKNYDKTIRPEKNVNIGTNFALKQIVTLDEKNQVITTSSVLLLNWLDSRLIWNPLSNNNITFLSISSNLVWLPDLYVTNTADTNGFVAFNTGNLGYLNYSGVISFKVALVGKLAKLIYIVRIIIIYFRL